MNVFPCGAGIATRGPFHGMATVLEWGSNQSISSNSGVELHDFDYTYIVWNRSVKRVDLMEMGYDMVFNGIASKTYQKFISFLFYFI